jgi:hypothetical protein
MAMSTNQTRESEAQNRVQVLHETSPLALSADFRKREPRTEKVCTDPECTRLPVQTSDASHSLFFDPKMLRSEHIICMYQQSSTTNVSEQSCDGRSQFEKSY